MSLRILRGVRVATPAGIQPASVHINAGKIAAVAGYDDVPRMAQPEELGKSLLMPGIVHLLAERFAGDAEAAAGSGITTLLTREPAAFAFVDESRCDAAAAPLPFALSSYLPALWTRARDRGESLESLVRGLSRLPAARAGLAGIKGEIAIDHDADLVIWNPELTVVGSSPLLYGAIRQTILRGRTIFRDGELVGEPSGQLVAASRG